MYTETVPGLYYKPGLHSCIASGAAPLYVLREERYSPWLNVFTVKKTTKSARLDVCELPYSIVYLFRDQKNKGRCVVAFKGHKTEYFQLTPEENAGYFADVAKVAKVLDELYHPDKINYATYGDGMPHVHVHIVPKYKGGVSWGQPFSDSLPKVLLTDAEYDAMIADLRAKLL